MNHINHINHINSNKILLQPITIDNWRDVIALDPGIQNQSFIEPNHVTLLEIMFRFPTTYDQYLRGIYCNDQLVGLTAFYYTYSNKNVFIHTFMIDHRFQGNGLGKESFRIVLDHIREHFDLDTIELSSNNPIAIQMYKNFGFVVKEDLEYVKKYGEQLFVLRL